MSGIPRLPGLEKFPELEKKFRRQYRALRAKSTSCGDCELSRLVEATRVQLEARQKRDK